MGIRQKVSIPVSGRVSATDENYEAIVDFLEDAERKGHTVSSVIAKALAYLATDVETISYADNATGELARFRDEEAKRNAQTNIIMAQFDIVNERLDVIIEKIEYLKAHGFEATVNEVMENEGLPPHLVDDMAERFKKNR